MADMVTSIIAININTNYRIVVDSFAERIHLSVNRTLTYQHELSGTETDSASMH